MISDIQKNYLESLSQVIDNLNPSHTGWNLPNVDYSKHPELYRVAKGEQGVFTVEPYRTNLIQFWRFRTPDVAREAAEKLYDMYLSYRDEGDFVGMDMTRKFVMMGYTRAMRFANYKGGRRFSKDGEPAERREKPDPVKVASALIFRDVWDDIRKDPIYQAMLKQHLSIEKDIFASDFSSKK
eukprot:GDKJ01008489.1.p1 GENE.GDKJ01008489.1~~GDKJ01008489.1.p1  ORF type:complete len:182 (-),score=22.47 GDKJ01008489.1:34-579(-)